MIYYSDYILTDHFRKMFAYADILLRRSMGIGEFYLFEKMVIQFAWSTNV